jgi:hypothetical protein
MMTTNDRKDRVSLLHVGGGVAWALAWFFARNIDSPYPIALGVGGATVFFVATLVAPTFWWGIRSMCARVGAKCMQSAYN